MKITRFVLLAAIPASFSSADPQVTLRALQGDATPVAGSNFGGTFGTPVINSVGDVAFTAVSSGPNTGGVYSITGGTLHLIAKNGDVAPGSGGRTFVDFGAPLIYLNDNSAVTFSHGLNGSPSGSTGIWTQYLGGLNVVALNAMQAPSAPFGSYIMTGFEAIAVAPSGQIAFNCPFIDGVPRTWAALFSGQPGSIAMHARQDAPPSSTGFQAFGIPRINSTGIISVFANFTDGTNNRTGIYVGQSGGLTAAATSGSPAPDRNGDPLPGNVTYFTFASWAHNAHNYSAFFATLAGSLAGTTGLFIYDARGPHLVALPGDAPAGAPPGVVISSFFSSAPAYADNNDLLVGCTLTGPGVNSSNSLAILRYRGTTLSIAVRAGDPLADRPGSFVGIPSSATVCTNPYGQVAFAGFITPSNADALIATDRAGNIVTALASSSVFQVRPNMRRTFNSFSTLPTGSGTDGRQRALNQLGDIVCSASCNIAPGEPFGQNGRSIIVVRIPELCPPDFNGDRVVDFFDYLDFVQAFSGLTPDADFNRDGIIDFFDYLDFVQGFSLGC